MSPGSRAHAVIVTVAGGTYCIPGDAVVTYEIGDPEP